MVQHLAQRHVAGLSVAAAVPGVVELAQEPVLPLDRLLLARLRPTVGATGLLISSQQHV